VKALLLFFSENNDYYLFVCDEFICTRYRGLIPVGDIFYYETPVNIHVISSYGEETFRSFFCFERQFQQSGIDRENNAAQAAIYTL
jgi:hypothetical protein